ncbi:MAG: glycosyltransferase, partial [Xanthomonadales bacterium]|nr:glycosyltransferase [Xanthomonadales bacterium]
RLFHFTFAPGGQDAMQLQACGDGAGLHAPVRVRWGEPGHLADHAAAAPLRALADADRAWLADADTLAKLARRPVTVIVPIHNAAPAFARALQALQQHTQLDASLLLIDDASTDPAISDLLAHAATWPQVQILRNPSNLGFTATVNRGLRQTLGDVVLLNADTEVGPGWLGALRAAAYAGADIASATAVSNNAGAFSVPELEQANGVPDGWAYADAARALRQSSGLIQPQLPTGNGFCLLLRADARAQVGELDEQAFAQGYGEENDWCQRASALGWRHIIAGNVYVAHARSQSFGDARRAALGALGMAVLRQRYPQYEADVGAQLFSFERLALDWRVRRLWAQAVAQPPPLPRVLLLGVKECAWPGWARWRVMDAGGGVACVDADAQVQASSSLECFDAVLPLWLQRHGIEALLCTSVKLAHYATMCATLGVACLDASASHAPRRGTFEV